jgi:DNA ligase D-like protein (predicted ligase)
MASPLTDALKEKAEKKTQPDWMEPTLAKLTEEYFSNPDWIYERKLDGVRCLIFKKGKTVKLLSRNKKEQNHIYPELAEALKDQEHDFIADGEIVTFDGSLTSFSKLQARMNVQNPSKELIEKTKVWFYLFDCMYIDGYDITPLDTRSRKAILKKGVNFEDPIRYLSHINENGEEYHADACKKGWEGVIAKDATKSYVHSRSPNWLKFKCVHQQELVIGGFTPPQGQRKGFGAILVGYYEDDELRYAGKVGTGYSDKELEELREKFDKLERKTSPFSDGVDEKGARWMTPELVAEIGFTEWTSDHKLRHPRYLGMRHDKKAKDVVREAP